MIGNRPERKSIRDRRRGVNQPEGKEVEEESRTGLWREEGRRSCVGERDQSLCNPCPRIAFNDFVPDPDKSNVQHVKVRERERERERVNAGMEKKLF